MKALVGLLAACVVFFVSSLSGPAQVGFSFCSGGGAPSYYPWDGGYYGYPGYAYDSYYPSYYGFGWGGYYRPWWRHRYYGGWQRHGGGGGDGRRRGGGARG